jgi:SAM-dependent methyltransferase
VRPPSSYERDAELSMLLLDPKTAGTALHLSSRSATLNYLRFADEIKRHVPAGRVLDWGAGSGHVSWLLDRRGLDVVSFDLADLRDPRLALPHIPFVLAPDDRLLPFPDESFDAVLSCGVLEHVADDHTSLREIRRILRPGSHFFIYQLPQKYAYTEWFNRIRGLWFHERCYTLRGARSMLGQTGFRVTLARRHNLFPKNLTGLPHQLRTAYNRFGGPLSHLESILVRVPVIDRLCHSLELIAQKM